MEGDGMSDKLRDFKNQIVFEHLCPLERKIQEMWPNEEPKVTLLVRTPWLPDGGILITNDELDDAAAELRRLQTKEVVR
jgi:hypothetical protein